MNQKTLRGETLLVCRHPPSRVYRDYRRYRPWLRSDFDHRCGYCGIHEGESWGFIFAIDHFKPKNHFRSLINDYSNLIYSCAKCNRSKSDDWPSDDPLMSGLGYIDPCVSDYDVFFKELGDCTVLGLQPVAEYMIEKLEFNGPFLIGVRRERKQLADEVKQYTKALEDLDKKIKNENLMNIEPWPELRDGMAKCLELLKKKIQKNCTPYP